MQKSSAFRAQITILNTVKVGYLLVFNGLAVCPLIRAQVVAVGCGNRYQK
jgi:hypothetical protein